MFPEFNTLINKELKLPTGNRFNICSAINQGGVTTLYSLYVCAKMRKRFMGLRRQTQWIERLVLELKFV